MGTGLGVKPGYYSDQQAYASGRNSVNLKWVSQAAGVLPAVGFPGTIAGGWLQAGGGAVNAVAFTATGIYTVTLNDSWADLIGFDFFIKQAAAFSAAGACAVFVTADNTAVDGTRTLVLLVTNAAGAAVNPAVNDVISLEITLQSFNAN